MASLQKFKLLATQCGVAQSPTRSPRTSPVVHFRRRKTTLRMLLSRSSSRRSPSRRELPSQQQRLVTDLTEKKSSSRSKDIAGRTLKDLFVSSPPFEAEEEKVNGKCEVFSAKMTGVCVGGGLSGEPGSPRPVWVGFRHRLLRRVWRPMLVTISE